ncbi:MULTISPECIES: hypothetical protein [unclassified Prevotella]|uniref:hypothetical protein n=1 Tax=unclassified Prevotella TaxID=2638335 RepID=UPI00051B0AF9|nr:MULTISPECIES: hypothetical protein [unclassified Prevotella]
MNEEMYIQEKVGKRNPFRVPEGYFDNLTAQVMQNLPEQPQQRRAKSVFVRPVFYAAASVCALLVAGAAWMWQSKADTTAVTAVQAKVENRSQQSENEEYMDEAADYMMLDNHEIYSYLASASE